jgi:hypothetical protein
MIIILTNNISPYFLLDILYHGWVESIDEWVKKERKSVVKSFEIPNMRDVQ